MKISWWIQLVWDLMKNAGRWQSSRARPAKKVPFQTLLLWLQNLQNTQSDRQSEHSRDLNHRHEVPILSVSIKDRRTQHQETSLPGRMTFFQLKRGGWGWKDGDVWPTVQRVWLTWLMSFQQKSNGLFLAPASCHISFEESIQRKVKVYCPQNKQPWLEAGSWVRYPMRLGGEKPE